MKIAGIILAVLMLLGAAFVGGAGSNKSLDLSKEIAGVSDVLSEAQIEAAGIPSAGRLKFGGIVGILGALSAFVLLVVSFVRKDKVLVVAGAMMAFSILAIILYPSVPTGGADGLAPRPQAMLAAALALVGVGGALMAKKASERS